MPDKLNRNASILEQHAAGRTMQEIANQFCITRSRVQQIVKANHPLGKTAGLLPDSESLAPATRTLLIRHSYATRSDVALAIQRGILRAGCFFGMGEKRFSEIQLWCSICK